MKLKEIADKISVHLKRFEDDPVINAPYNGKRLGFHPYYRAGAHSGGRYVYVGYVAYQGSAHLTKDEAERYLAWLDAGNVGRHYAALAETEV